MYIPKSHNYIRRYRCKIFYKSNVRASPDIEHYLLDPASSPTSIFHEATQHALIPDSVIDSHCQYPAAQNRPDSRS